MNNLSLKNIKQNTELNKILDGYKLILETFAPNISLEKKSELIFIQDSLYESWVFTPLVSETYLTPAYLYSNINNNTDYHILPRVTFDISKDNNITFKENFLYYSIDSHPVLEDIDKLLKYKKGFLVLRDDIPYGLDCDEEFLNTLNFKSIYYIKYLTAIMHSLGLIKHMRGINCSSFKPVSKSINDFINQSNIDKLKVIIFKSAQYSAFRLNDFDLGYNFTIDDILDFIDNNIDLEDYMRGFNNLFLELERKFDEEYSSVTGKAELNNLIKQFGSKEDFIIYNITSIYKKAFNYNITTIFGYYLGIILPTKSDEFPIDKLLNRFISEPTEYFRMILDLSDEAHDLTNFGHLIAKELGLKLNNKLFKPMPKKDIYDFIDEYVNITLNTINEAKDSTNNTKTIEHLHNNTIDMFHKYLIFKCNLSEKTANKYADLAYYFLSDSGLFECVEDFEELTKETLKNYIIQIYIPHYATSKSNVLDFLRSLKRFIQFIYSVNFIQTETYNNIMPLFKENDYFIDEFEKYFYHEDNFLF